MNPSVRLRVLVTVLVALIGIGFVLLLSSTSSDSGKNEVTSSGSDLASTEAAKRAQAEAAARESQIDDAFKRSVEREEAVEQAGGHEHSSVGDPEVIKKVAETFAGAFVQYELGKPTREAKEALQSSAGPLLQEEMSFTPARQPLNGPKPKPASVEWISEPTSNEIGGETTYTVGVRFHREASYGALDRSFVLTLQLVGEGKDLRVFDIQGGE